MPEQAQKNAATWAGVTFIGLIAVVLLAVNIPGAALYGDGNRFARWVEARRYLYYL